LCLALLCQLPAAAHALRDNGLAHAVELSLLLLMFHHHQHLYTPLLLHCHKRARTAELHWHSTLHTQIHSCGQ
jgi:hypothetical protein